MRHEGRKGQAGGKQRHRLHRRVGRDQPALVGVLEHIVGVFIGSIGAARTIRDGLHAHVVDQLAGHGTTDQAAEHQTESGCSHTQVRRAGNVVLFFQHLAPGTGRTMATRQRDGARHQADQRIQPQRRGEAHAHRVLDQDEHAHHRQKHHQADTPGLEPREVGTQADGREEDQHEGILQALVEGKRHARAGMQDVDDHGGQQPPGHRLGNVEVLQEPDPVHHQAAHQQYQGGNDQREIRVDGYRVHERPFRGETGRSRATHTEQGIPASAPATQGAILSTAHPRRRVSGPCAEGFGALLKGKP